MNFQGPDVGPQYRSEIFYSDPSQEKIARAYIAQLNDAKAFSMPVVTRVEPLQDFYEAEEYHQEYLIKHPERDYIVYFDLPKLDNLKRLFPDVYTPAPATVTMSSQTVHQSAPPPAGKKI